VKYIVSDEREFVYLVVQKVACSSIKTALVPLFDLDTAQYETVRKDGAQSLKVHKLFDNSGYQIGKLQFASELEGKYRDYFKFAFVRNPWDRLVSCYSQKLSDGKGDNIGRRSNLSPSISGIELYNGMPFDHFVQAIHAIPDDKANSHFRSQCATICDEDGNIMADFVGHFETLEEDFRYVAGEIGVPELQLPHLLRSKNREGRSYSEFYDDRLAELVYERYTKDIELFGYSFSPDCVDPPTEGRGSPMGRLATEPTKTDKLAETLQRRIEKIESELKEERRYTKSLKKQKRKAKRRVRSLERQIEAIRSSRTWKAMSALRRIKAWGSRKG
jgi:chondroitin 4-sulfotransferase 11